MAIIKSYTDLEQSKVLAEILPLESADMFYKAGNDTQPTFRLHSYGHIMSNDDVPCWSLASLLSVLPNFIGDYGKCLYYDIGGYYCGYMNDGDFMLAIEETKADNPIDACVEMIEKLHKLNLL
jgi:hypothetical protein